MAGLRILFCFLLAAVCYSAVFSQETSTEPGDDIPQQCIDNSKTPVSCEEVDLDDGLLPHPDDCELFYYCLAADKPPVCRQCPAHLHFNPTKKVCDLPEDAGCTVESGGNSGEAD